MKWAYLGEDTGLFLRTRAHFSGAERIGTAARLQNIAVSLRQEYIDYVGRLSCTFHSPDWWASELPEKNSSISTVFRNTCYVRLAMELARAEAGFPLVLVAETHVLRRTLSHQLRHLSVAAVSETRPWAERCAWAVALSRHAYYALRTLYYVMAAKWVLWRNGVPGVGHLKGRDLTVFFDWVDSRSVDGSGRYQDVYFGDLPARLKARNEAVAHVAFVLPTVSYTRTIAALLRTNQCFVFPFACLTVADVLSAAWRSLCLKPQQRASYPEFAGVNVDGFIQDDAARFWRTAMRFFPLLRWYLVRRWRRQGLNIRSVFHLYEGMRWERVLCLAIREFFPQAVVTGYAHSSFCWMKLDHFYSSYEAGLIPIPDRLLANGPRYIEVFKSAGFDESRLVEVGAFRYRYLYEPAPAQGRPRSRQGRPTILVALPIQANAGSELAWQAIEALRDCPEYSVLIKCHPVTPAHLLDGDLERALPAHFSFTELPMDALWDKVDLLLYSNSTVCLEALATGVPVVNVSSELVIDMDPLDVLPELRRVARNAEELRRFVKQAIEARNTDTVSERARWRCAVESMLGPVKPTLDI